jgi:hypothetical protein
VPLYIFDMQFMTYLDKLDPTSAQHPIEPELEKIAAAFFRGDPIPDDLPEERVRGSQNLYKISHTESNRAKVLKEEPLKDDKLVIFLQDIIFTNYMALAERNGSNFHNMRVRKSPRYEGFDAMIKIEEGILGLRPMVPGDEESFKKRFFEVSAFKELLAQIPKAIEEIPESEISKTTSSETTKSKAKKKKPRKRKKKVTVAQQLVANEDTGDEIQLTSVESNTQTTVETTIVDSIECDDSQVESKVSKHESGWVSFNNSSEESPRRVGLEPNHATPTDPVVHKSWGAVHGVANSYAAIEKPHHIVSDLSRDAATEDHDDKSWNVVNKKRYQKRGGLRKTPARNVQANSSVQTSNRLVS